MTEPTTRERCPTCLSDGPLLAYHHRLGRWVAETDDTVMPCRDPWHGSQDVEGVPGEGDVGPGEGAVTTVARKGPAAAPSTTQEAEKALEDAIEALARMLADARTRGNVYMDGSHNPLPSEYQKARMFVEDHIA